MYIHVRNIFDLISKYYSDLHDLLNKSGLGTKIPSDKIAKKKKKTTASSICFYSAKKTNHRYKVLNYAFEKTILVDVGEQEKNFSNSY